MPHASLDKVYVLLYRDDITATAIAVFSDLQDANHQCLQQATQSGLDLTSESSTTGPDKGALLPIEPIRWDTADGASCWVEEHEIAPKRILTPPPTQAAI
ncbi:hypothetical protein NLU13_5612 [Sarocladium strictum]|uniref:Uncharacterized protein n=1 Tax=Sarocladium strictum TaxID=5046 RepID=A0AA39GHZ8_SARSR|nr:hypothetical protein NLU13_5612 [Sarocladium strictum]